LAKSSSFSSSSSSSNFDDGENEDEEEDELGKRDVNGGRLGWHWQKKSFRKTNAQMPSLM
jgi:hypothetical protein